MKPFFCRLFFTLCLGLTGGVYAQKLEAVVQRGHFESVKALAFTPDSKYVLTASRDKSVKLWELATGREIRTYFGHGHTVNDLVVNREGTQFITSSADNTAKIWDIRTGNVIRTLALHREYLTTVDIGPEGKLALTGGYDSEAYLWDLQKEEVLQSFKANPDKGLGYGIHMQFSPNGKYIAIGNDNHTVQVYDAATAELIKELKPAEGWCGGCATFLDFSTSGKYLLKGSNNGALELYETENWSLVTTYQDNWDDFAALDVSQDERLVLAASEDSIKIWDMQSGNLIRGFTTDHKYPITDAVISPDGNWLATASDDNTVKVWKTANGQLVQTLRGILNTNDGTGLDFDPNSRWEHHIKKYTDFKHDIRLSPDGQYIVKGKIGSLARMWELSTGRIKQEFRGHEKAVLCFEFLHDGTHLITGSVDNTAILWEVETGKAIKTFKGHRELIFSMSISEDEQLLATGSWDGTAKIWDITTGELLTSISFENSSPYFLQFLENDIYLLVGGLDKSLKIFEIDTKKEIRELVGHNDNVQDAVLFPGSRILASAGWDGKVKIWDLSSGLQTMKLDLEQGAVHGLAINKDGRQLAIGTNDRMVTLWNVQNRHVIQTFAGHQSPVTSVRFSTDQKQIISCSQDGVIKVWDLATGNELFSHIIIGEKDWMVKDVRGYFNATEGARSVISFVKGMESYEVDQFFEEFYNPALLKNIYRDRSIPDKRINLLDKLERSPPPKVEILVPHEGETIHEEKTDLMVKVANQGGGIAGLKIMQNGKTLVHEKDIKSGGKGYVNNFPVHLVPGRNIFSVIAYSKGNIESRPVDLTVEHPKGAGGATLYLLAVGINQYKNPSLNLNYARSDAEGFTQLIAERSKKLYAEVEIHRIFDQEATKENILQKLDWLSARIRPDDVLFFYYAGHGSMVEDKFYFIPADNVRLYSEDKLKKEAISAEELQEHLKRIAALKQLMVIDACQSGGSVEVLASRGAVEEKALAQLSRSAGVHVLSAAGSEQFASEFSELGHGLFTYVLLQALAGEADGAPSDGKVTIYELKSYLDDQVPEYSLKFRGKPQYPYTFSRGHDFPLIIFK